MVRLRESVALAQLEAQVVNASAGERAAALAVFQAEARARTDAEAGIRGSVSLTQDERVAIEEAARARQTAADTEDRLNRLRSEGESVTRRYRTAQQAMNAEIKTLTDLFKEGAINAETFERAVTELQNNLNGLAEAARSIDQVFASAFEDAISGGKSFMDVLKALERDLLRIGTRLAMQTISSAIFGGGGKGGGGGIGGFIMSALGSVFGGGRAAGGPVDPSRWYVVGERGPEIFRPSTAGRIEPNQGGATRGGGGRPVNVFFQGVRDMNSFRDSQSAMAAFTTRAVMRGQRGL